nr:phospholipase-like protein [Tanacetum cinerariifolium]
MSFDLHSSGELKFQNMVFFNKIGFSITNLDIIGVIEDEEIFGKLSDDDAIRLCLFLALELEKARTRGKTGFMVSLIGGTTDNSVRKNWLNDLVIMELNFRLFKLETIIQVLLHERSDRHAKLKFTDEFSNMTSDLCDSLNSMFADLIEPANPDEDIAQDYLREEELRLCLEGEEKMRCEHQKLIVEENRIRLDEAKRLRLEEENMERYTTSWSEVDQLMKRENIGVLPSFILCLGR